MNPQAGQTRKELLWRCFPDRRTCAPRHILKGDVSSQCSLGPLVGAEFRIVAHHMLSGHNPHKVGAIFGGQRVTN